MDSHWSFIGIQTLQDSLELADCAWENVARLVSRPVHCAQGAGDPLAILLLIDLTNLLLPRPSCFSQACSCPGILDYLAFSYDLGPFPL